MTLKGNYSRVNSARQGKGGNYLDPGNYRVRIIQVTEKDSQKTPGEVLFIVEFEVLASDNPDVGVGAVKSQSINLKNWGAMGDINALISAVFSADESAVTEKHVAKALSEAQPMAGAVMDLRVWTKRYTNKEGQPKEFSMHQWSRPEATE